MFICTAESLCSYLKHYNKATILQFKKMQMKNNKRKKERNWASQVAQR